MRRPVVADNPHRTELLWQLEHERPKLVSFQGFGNLFALGALANGKQRVLVISQPAVTDGVLIDIAHDIFQLGFGTACHLQSLQPSFNRDRCDVP